MITMFTQLNNHNAYRRKSQHNKMGNLWYLQSLRVFTILNHLRNIRETVGVLAKKIQYSIAYNTT